MAEERKGQQVDTLTMNGAQIAEGQVVEPIQEQKVEQKQEPENSTLEFLRKQAEGLGLDPLKVSTADEQKLLQMMLDKRAQQAVETHKRKEEQKREEEELRKKGEFEKLLRQERKEHLSDFLETKLEAYNLKGLKEYINLDPLVDEDKAEAKNKISTMVESISQYIAAEVDKRVKEKMAEKEKGTFAPVAQEKGLKTNDELSKIQERLEGKI
ncbi:MAG TPA: hypothetical protein VIL29_10965 [Pseudothermotoga sp.]